MALASGYRVQTRQIGESWRTVRTWTDKAAAEGDARAIFAERRVIAGVFRGPDDQPFAVPIHPYVRVMHGRLVALSLDATTRGC